MAALVPIGNPKGPKGDKGNQGEPGIPGTNGVPADGAVAGFVGTTSATREAMRNRDVLRNVREFGAQGDGTTDDTAAFVAALSAGSIMIPAGTYLITATINVADGRTIQGESRHSALLLHGFNGDMFTLGTNVKLADFAVNGQGATFTGRGMTVAGTRAAQMLTHLKVTDFEGPCLYFETAAGSRSMVSGCEMWRVNASTGSGRFAVVIDPAQQLLAVPRKFIGLETGGQCAIDFGGSNNTEVIGSILGDLGFDAGEARGVNILGCRLLNDLYLTVDGHGITITGCDVLPQITIAPGADGIVIGPNAYNNLPVIDLSGNSRNQVTHHMVAYNPELSSGGAAPTLGNGTLTGKFSRSGGQVRAVLNLFVGSTTNLGSGELRISLPTKRGDTTVETVGRARIQIGAVQYFADGDIPGAVDYVRLFRDGSGSVTATSPGTFAAGDLIRFGFTYNV